MSLREWAIDTAERAVFTFLEAFLGLLMISQTGAVDGIDPSLWQAALASGFIAALAVVKGAIASRRDGISPASLAMGASDHYDEARGHTLSE